MTLLLFPSNVPVTHTLLGLVIGTRGGSSGAAPVDIMVDSQ